MTRSIAMDSNYDLMTDSRGNLAMVTGAQACAQNSRSAMAVQRGELVLNLERGMPTMQTVWDRYDPAQFEAAARQILATVEGVQGVQSFDIVQEGDTVSYTATLLTQYGVIELGTL